MHHSIDLMTGVELSGHLLGKSSVLEVHHIFPKSKLYDYGYSKAEVNAIANFTFLTKDSNLEISNKDPHVYLADVKSRYPGALESHWIPTEPNLWSIEHYREFLAARRELLAGAANEMMDGLYAGTTSDTAVGGLSWDSGDSTTLGGITNEEEEERLFALNNWTKALQLASGDLLYDLADEETGEAIAIIDLAWPNGLQVGLTEPVALMIDEDNALRDKVAQCGYLVFTDEESFKAYASQAIITRYANVP